MLMQTNSYVVPKDKRVEHARLMRRIRQALMRLGCEQFEVYEQVGPGFAPLKENSRFVQIMRFRDRKHHQAVQEAERNDPAAQDLIREFCELVDLDSQRAQSLFAVGFYRGTLTPLSDSGHAAAEQVDVGVGEAPAVESRDFTTADLNPGDHRSTKVESEDKASADGSAPEPHS